MAELLELNQKNDLDAGEDRLLELWESLDEPTRKFADYYLRNPHQSIVAAYKHAGLYKSNNSSSTAAHVNAYKLLRRPDVAAYIKQYRLEIAKVTLVTADLLTRQYYSIFNRAMEKTAVKDSEGNILHYKFDGQTAVRALDSIAKLHGFDRKQIDINGTINVKYNELLTAAHQRLKAVNITDDMIEQAEFTEDSGSP